MICSMLSSAALAPTWGLAPAPSPSVTLTPNWTFWGARLPLRACASVLPTTKSTPSSDLSIMLLTALPPAPPTPNTVMRGSSSLPPEGFTRFNVMSRPPVIIWTPPLRRLIGPTLLNGSCTPRRKHSGQRCMRSSLNLPDRP